LTPIIKILSGVLLLFVLLCTEEIQAQKVALILSGGGSKGLAHVGVLKALEENNIPIDYIAGTSMGAIIGGLYASGYSPREIEKMVINPDFERWARGETEDKNIYYFKMPDPNASMVNLKVNYNDIKKKLESRLPTNLISPNRMDFAVLEYYASAAAASKYNFDSLFVPFRCVAAEIDSNKAVIFRNGQLGSAIRASMTYPFYFKPIQINGKILFDGGLYNNFPVDVAMSEFHPDVIIGSKAVSNFPEPQHNDLMSQIQNIIVKETNFSVPEKNGILIEPDLPVANVIDFTLKQEFIDSGYVSANRAMDKIKALIPARVDKNVLNARRKQFIDSKPPVIIDTIQVEGLKKYQAIYVRKLLKKKSRYITLPALKEEYFKLLADNKIKYIFPTLIFEPETGFYKLCLDIERAEHFMVEFGGNVSSSAANAAFIALEYRYFGKVGITTSGNGYFGRFYSSANLSARFDFPSKIPYFLALNYTYNHKNYFRNSTYFLEDLTPNFLIQNENHGGIDIGAPATNKGKIVADFYTGYTKDEYYQTNSFSRADTTDKTYFNFITPGLAFELNSLNYKQYATSGAQMLITLKYIRGREKTIPGSTSASEKGEYNAYHDWFQFRLIYDNYFLTLKPLKLGFYGELLLSDQEFFDNYTATILRTPAFEPIPEMKILFLPKYRAPSYAALGLKMLFTIYRQVHFRVEGYLFQPYEELLQGENQKAVRGEPFSYRSVVGSAALVYQSPIGPISLSFNYYDRANDDFSILFNIGYIIFNKGALE
jgi:NTE family protein